MTRIAERFTKLRAQNECALIPYLTAGFPSADKTVALMQALERGGADLIELGVPFSDPIADGPTIQRASASALAAGITLKRILEIVREFRKSSTVPVILFGAYNPFFHYGMEKFCADAAAAGADGLLIPDLPADEAAEVGPHMKATGLDLILLVAPTTPRERKAEICAKGSGFIYYISIKGVTGARTNITYDLEAPLAEIRACSDLPIAVGFGLSKPEQAGGIAQFADGAVIGSALIDHIDKNAAAGDLPDKVERFLSPFKTALREARSNAGAANK